MSTSLPKNLQLTREQRLAEITQQQCWDMIIVGGGITGAGIFKLASQAGLKVLLLEQKDFAWGSSSRSSKMVHGGLRYIAEGQIGLTLESVRERQRLLKEAPGLVKSQSFAISHYVGKFPWPWVFNLLLSIYDLLALKKQHRYWPKNDFQYLNPGAKFENSCGGSQFTDAMTDDGRLVLRLIQEAQQLGGQALNYVEVTELIKQSHADNRYQVTGVVARPKEAESPLSLSANVVVNATGAWANQLFEQTEEQFPLRPLRGSHLILPAWRLPVATAISVLHPHDNRPVIIYPWQNATVVGTTDVEHQRALDKEPVISRMELDYLLDCVTHQFPAAKITQQDIISTYAGVRPVVASGGLVKPSKEKREHCIKQSNGVITVAGGKLTTFRVIAEEVLKLVLSAQEIAKIDFSSAIFDSANPIDKYCYKKNKQLLSEHILEKIVGNYGGLAEAFITQFNRQQLSYIGYSNNLWAELVWAMKYEQVYHLDDLLLRRTRIGNLLPNGAMENMSHIKTLCLSHLDWSEQQWERELARYQKIWLASYSLPQEQ